MIVPYRLALTDGATINLSLNDNIQFANPRFAPVVAPRQRSPLARGGPYLPVVQPITVDILGDTPARCWENLASLLGILHQADRWYNDDAPVNPICLLVQTVAAAPVVQAELFGFNEQDTPLTIDDTFQVYTTRYAIRDVEIAVVRAGAWETATETAVASTSGANPAVLTTTWASSKDTYSRMRLYGLMTNQDAGLVRLNNTAFVLLASAAAKFNIVDSVSLSTPALASNFTDTTNNAYGNSVKRFQASTTAIQSNVAISWSTPKRRIGVYAAVRNNSATTTFYVQAEVSDIDGTTNRAPVTVIPPSTLLPQIVYLGLITSRFDQALAYILNLYVSASQTSASHTLDIDYVVLQCLDDPWADRALVYGNGLSSSGGLRYLIVEPGGSIQRTPYPLVLIQATGNPQMASTSLRGDAYLVTTGQTVSVMVLSTNGDAKWRLYDSSNAQVAIHYTSNRRTVAYLTPPGV